MYFESFEKTPNFGRTVHTLDYTQNLKLKFSEAFLQRWIGIWFLDDFEGLIEKNMPLHIG